MLKVKKLHGVQHVLVDAYTQGATIRDLALTYDCSPGTIRDRLLAKGTKLRSRGRKKKEIK